MLRPSDVAYDRQNWEANMYPPHYDPFSQRLMTCEQLVILQVMES